MKLKQVFTGPIHTRNGKRSRTARQTRYETFHRVTVIMSSLGGGVKDVKMIKIGIVPLAQFLY